MTPPKPKTQYQCQQCQAISNSWRGQCLQCKEWNTLQQMAVPAATTSKIKPMDPNRLLRLSDVGTSQGGSGKKRGLDTSLQKIDYVFDKVTGGGLQAGSITVLGGEPGCGKSSLFLTLASAAAADQRVLYISAEEVPEALARRAIRMQLDLESIHVLPSHQLPEIIAAMQQCDLLIVDSIQTISDSSLSGVAGSVSQVRHCASEIVKQAHSTGQTVLLVGHVTKGGDLAGPRVLEHLVDTSLMLEYSSDPRYRLLRSIKNRYGATGQVGIYVMEDKGLTAVSNPSAIFLARSEHPSPGSLVTVLDNGNVPLLLEIQALVNNAQTKYIHSVGLDRDRVRMLLAVLEHHIQLDMSQSEIYCSAVGGVSATNTSVDLALLLALMSSKLNKAVPSSWVAFGEVSLSGEVRPVAKGEMRLQEAARLGFTKAIVPQKNVSKAEYGQLEVVGVSTVKELSSLASA